MSIPLFAKEEREAKNIPRCVLHVAITNGGPDGEDREPEDDSPFDYTMTSSEFDRTWVPKIKAVVEEGLLMFGGAHFREYHFLLIGGPEIWGVGLEHRKCSLSSLSTVAIGDFNAASVWEKVTPGHE